MSRQVLLSEVCKITKGKTAIMKADAGPYPLIATAADFHTCSDFDFDCKAVCIPLVSATGHGHASIKRLHYFNGKFALGTILCAVSSKNEEILDTEYLYLYLSFLKDELLVPLMKGSANVSLTVTSLKSLEIALPSIQRQKELLPKLKKAVATKEKLENLNGGQAEIIKDLRAAILQLAVQGKLVPQDPNDEPFALSGKRHKKKPNKIIEHEEYLFEIPNKWSWERLANLVYFLGGHAYKSSKFFKKTTNNQVVRIGNVKDNGIITETNPVFIDDIYASETEKYKLKEDDVLITMTGTKGKQDYLLTTKVTSKDLAFSSLFLNQRVGCLRGQTINPDFLVVLLKCPDIRKFLYEQSTGTANQANIGSTQIMNIALPIPPLAEQKRIVEKVDHLMAMCDQLEQQIGQSEKLSAALMDSILHHAFAQDEEAREAA